MRVKAGFVEPMLLLRTDTLPDDPDGWAYELKLDGYRAIAFKAEGKVRLRSRNDNDFSNRYASVMPGLAKLPNETVVGSKTGLRNSTFASYASGSRFCNAARARDFVHMPWAMFVGKPNAFAVIGYR